jgi:hypothetical protein
MLIRTLVVAAAATVLLSTPARAQDQATIAAAREMAKRGMVAYDAGKFDEAEEKLGRAYEVVKVPTLALYRARALRQLGKLVEAAELYLEATQLEVGAREKARQKARQLAAQRDAERERSELLPRIPNVVVELEDADADAVTVTIDGVPIPGALLGSPRPVNPGERQVLGTRGTQEVRETVTLAEAETKTVRLRFGPDPSAKPEEPPPAPPPSEAPPADEPPDEPGWLPHQRTVGWIGLGVGGAGLVFGSVMGLRAMAQQSELDKHGCSDGHCYGDQSSDIDAYDTSRTLSTIGYAVGGVGVAAGIVLLLTAPSEQEAPPVSAWIGPRMAGVQGRFW